MNAPTNSRDVILGRVKAALGDVTATPDDEPVAWTYGTSTPMDDVVARFVEQVEDYRAEVETCSVAEIPGRVAAALRSYDAESVVVPPGLDRAWVAEAIGVFEDASFSSAQLDAIDAVVTACAVGVAETGTIVLDHGPDQGRRALSLVPDVHVCIVQTDQVVSDVPEAIVRLGDAAKDRMPMTFISGPSATSDIELSRVEGVHGPRKLHVIVVTD